MITLAVDTAGPVIGVGLWDGRRATERTLRLTRGAEEHLSELIDDLCTAASVRVGDIQGIGVAIGPGAFTGLRVGVATAGGLGSALQVPVWPVSSLVPRAARAGFGGELLVMLDARKGRVYAGLWRSERQEGPTADVPPEVALGWVTGAAFRAAGEGAEVYRGAVEARGGTVVPEAEHPGTALLAELCAQGLDRGEGIDPLALRTEYLRDPDAVARPRSPRAG